MIEALNIQVRGIVQGVGFRPFVYKLAKKYLINGWVLNSVEGVTIHAEGESKYLDEFVVEISEHHPAAAQVNEIELKEVPLEEFDSFEIRHSEETQAETTTLISPDLATCEDCRQELFNPNDRRYRYPFINCTNCGPRFTIIDDLPYDRERTSMAEFKMCPRCQEEYDDPLNRRFHAQPNACFDCGPKVSFLTSEQARAMTAPLPVLDAGSSQLTPSPAWGETREQSDAILAEAANLLKQGKILAVKGLGGFHLACDAENEQAIAELRKRKRREGKPFAVMMKDIDQVRQYCEVNEIEEQLLTGTQRPIVLLKKRLNAHFAKGLADDLAELGVMLPYTPVQHLLMNDFGGVAVMTSGNIHDEPIVTNDVQAYEMLNEIADAFLGNNRAIRARYDDSVMRVIQVAPETYAYQVIRRARGYAPLPLSLHEPSLPQVTQPETARSQNDGAQTTHTSESVFATGPEQKNTFCLTRDNQAFVSQHIGDMENAETFDAWLATKAAYQRLFDISPTHIACDMHPEYLTTKWAHDQKGIPVTEVQHHHAHIVSVMAENQIEDAICGFTFDGTGYGADKAIWGGEVLLSNLQTYERFANFAYVPMPGGAAAIKNPARMAYGALWAFDLLDHPAAQDVITALGPEADICAQMIEKGINTPVTSSVGRLFDAVSALLGVCKTPLYEGEAAVLLEAALDRSAQEPAPYPVEITKNTATETSTALDTSVVLIDLAPAFKAILDDKQAKVETSVIARRFHDTIVAVIVQMAQLVQATYDINTFALSGGVFLNRYLIEHAVDALSSQGFAVALNKELPPGDGCISFGQAVVALQLKNE